MSNRIKKPWPTKDAMEQIYELNLWGGFHTDFYSGDGSHNPNLVEPYIKAVRDFLTTFAKPLVVCDLGCGDFNIGRQLFGLTKRYIAIDIVESLIKRNRNKFGGENIEFHCLDIATDNMPSADCILLRQVLQHLSNNEVESVVRKLPNYNYVILTEHLPEGNFQPNKDIISGQGIRLKKNSGIDLLAPPFNLKVKETIPLLSIPLDENKGVIVTTLFQMY
ncbi:class I SAM-dependent methyltransferase [Galbibacter mesophilus]|uniref:class I SAM-dependent methyltransferase n=1 Tax=Galbibacter mesophilus TaxID=379069 RepID=UPI00191CAA8A|nr:class I SAM-dependent methyltransferase [Galbibacter mesophilus]MCM5662173.1 class I SAM-dependent methyltransferase [Galbibacter mesophilus]